MWISEVALNSLAREFAFGGGGGGGGLRSASRAIQSKG
jgi:hypothetical protein